MKTREITNDANPRVGRLADVRELLSFATVVLGLIGAVITQIGQPWLVLGVLALTGLFLFLLLAGFWPKQQKGRTVPGPSPATVPVS